MAIIALISASTILAGDLADSRAEDWPTYAHDNARGASTSDILSFPLTQNWTFRSKVPPRPAWDEPATWDGYNKVYDLKNRQDFDKAFHVVSVGNSVFFGSSADDKVYSLDAKTGELKWQFYTEAPIRLAPSVSNNRIFIGSDDGYVYCLNANSGELIWRYRPGPSPRRIAGNGRLVSPWAIRTGIVVADGVAYCCAGVFPWEGVYLCALDAEDGHKIWETVMKDFPAQGYMLASAQRLYITTGRDRPLVFDRATGKRLFQVTGGGGGTYALLTGDTFIYGPGKTGQMALYAKGSPDQLASFAGNHMILRGPMSYLHTDAELSALDRVKYLRLLAERGKILTTKNQLSKKLKKATSQQKDSIKLKIGELSQQIDAYSLKMQACILWKTPCDCPLSLITTKTAAITGGGDHVRAFNLEDGANIWEAAVQGQAYGLAVANGQLFVSTDKGNIHCFATPSKTASQ